jgi:hypothetical protein
MLYKKYKLFVIEALKTNHIKTVLFILRIIDKEERKSYA